MVEAKIAGAVMIIAAASLMGFLYSHELQKRIENLYEIQRILVMLRGEMKYHQAPITEVFQGMKGHVNTEFQQLFAKAAENLQQSHGKTIGQIWLECCDLLLEKISLSKEDRQEFRRLGEILGYLDTDTQAAGFELYGQKIELRIQKCSKELAGKQRLIRCLGIMGGIFVVIFFI